MDFKGWFITDKGTRYDPLTVLDDHPRDNLILKACSGRKGTQVRPHLIDAFERFGLPRQILCDHGSPWGRRRVDLLDLQAGITKMQLWLTRLGVDFIRGRVCHPQTQGTKE